MRNNNRSKSRTGLIVTVTMIVLVIYLVLGVFLSPMYVDGESMSPTLSDNKMIYVQRAFYRIDYNTILIFKKPQEDYDCVKRVMGMPGDRVSIIDGKLIVNGKAADDKFASWKMHDAAEITLKPDEYYLLGDNRADSLDSRVYGGVKKSNIIGKCLFVE